MYEEQISVGLQAGGKVDKSVGKMMNVGGVELVAIKIGVKASTVGLENTSEFRYIGEDGNILYNSKTSTSASVGAVGGGLK